MKPNEGMEGAINLAMNQHAQSVADSVDTSKDDFFLEVALMTGEYYQALRKANLPKNLVENLTSTFHERVLNLVISQAMLEVSRVGQEAAAEGDQEEPS